MTKKLFIALIIILCLYSAVDTFAQTDTIVRSSMDTRAELEAHCTQTNIKVEDLYNKAITLLDSIGNKDANNYKQSLTASHKAWLIYSSSHCDIIAYQSRDAAIGGDSFYYGCKGTLNEVRIKELEELLDNLQLESGFAEIK